MIVGVHFKIVSHDFYVAAQLACFLASHPYMKSGLCSGKLITWKDDRGFGFIQPADGSPEIFVHISELKNSTRRPQKNDTIYYRAVTDSDGKISACDAFILGARSKNASDVVSASKFPGLEALGLSILPSVGAVHLAWATYNLLPIVLYPAMSLLTYALYTEDKSRAKRRAWRIPEQTLHLCELAGGWFGGFIAQRMLRHKNQKKSYQAEFWAIVAIHHVAWLLWLLWDRT